MIDKNTLTDISIIQKIREHFLLDISSKLGKKFWKSTFNPTLSKSWRDEFKKTRTYSATDNNLEW